MGGYSNNKTKPVKMQTFKEESLFFVTSFHPLIPNKSRQEDGKAMWCLWFSQLKKKPLSCASKPTILMFTSLDVRPSLINI